MGLSQVIKIAVPATCTITHATMQGQGLGQGSMSSEERQAIQEECNETESLLQNSWASRTALPQLHIRQSIGELGVRDVRRACGGCITGSACMLILLDIMLRCVRHIQGRRLVYCDLTGDASGPGCIVWESGVALAEYLSCHLGAGEPLQILMLMKVHSEICSMSVLITCHCCKG